MVSLQHDARPKRSSSLRRLEQKLRPYVLPSIATVGRSNSTRGISSSTRQPSSITPGDAHNETRLYQSLLEKRTLRKMPKTNNLSIDVPGVASLQQSDARSGLASPRTPHTPRTPSHGTTAAANGENKGQYGEGYDNHVHSPINALPPPPSPRSPKVKTSKIFGNKLASKSATKVNKIHQDLSPQQPSGTGSRSPGGGNTNASKSQIYSSSNLGVAINKSSPDVSVSHPYSGQSSPDAVEFSPEQTSLNNNNDGTGAASKEKGVGLQKSKTQTKFGTFLGRKASLRGDEPLPPQSASLSRDKPKPGPIKTISQPIDVPVRTAPVEKERGFRSAMNSALRNRSLDRATEDERVPSSQHAHKPSSLGPNGLSGNSHGSIVSNLKSGGTRAAEGISKARKGLFGNFKLNRSGSSHEREPMRNEPYELKVLVLPLEEQARITRIAKRLHYCKDKTEFWLPAFPYRCIDYLSDRGTYSEGLYRVPGSELEIKHYMARFDREYDIDLFDQKDLHDVNVVATMLKRWLSNLPPVFPPETQTDIIRTCSESHPAVAGGSTPDYMKQKLSDLPPWNYYLLFAITGHISFLHNHRDQNKMTYENLFRCFATRALQVEPYIFWWLVWDWRNCWLGCSKEDEYKAKEYIILEQEADQAAEEEKAAAALTPVVEKKKESRGDDSQAKQRKASKHSVSAISKQSVHTPSSTIKQVKSGSEQRPQTAHTHSHSKSQPQPMPSSESRSRSREKTVAERERDKEKEREKEKEKEKEKEREKEKEKEQQRNLSSSDSSKPSITGQSSGGRSASPSTSAGKDDEEHLHVQAHPAAAQVKSQEMSLPMLSPLKPLSPLGLH